MRDFFKPWRRKIGAAMLVVVSLFVAGWIRSFWTQDAIVLLGIEVEYSVKSVDGRMYWERYESLASNSQYLSAWAKSRPIELEEFRQDGLPPREQWIVPYWSIVLPLTLLAAWLLLSKPRPAKPIAPPEPDHA